MVSLYSSKCLETPIVKKKKIIICFQKCKHFRCEISTSTRPEKHVSKDYFLFFKKCFV